MHNSPFIFGKIARGQAFTNREDEIKRLTNNFSSGINSVIISPRRIGKSSLVDYVVKKSREENQEIKIVQLDLFATATEAEFLTLYAKEVVKASSTKFEEWVSTLKRAFKQLTPKISFGVDPNNEFAISFDWEELKKHKDEILDLPENISAQKGIKMVICLDEFQNIVEFEDSQKFEKKLRSKWQKHQRVSYCIYGSYRHMMHGIFDEPSRPFYRFGDLMVLQRIDIEKWITFLVDNFQQTGKEISRKEAYAIADDMQCHPWYVQQLAHYTWSITDKRVNPAFIQKALDEVIIANSPFFQLEFESWTSKQKNLFKAILHNEKKLTGTNAMNKYHLGTPNGIRKNLIKFIERDIIEKTDSGYVLLDPAFRIWLKRIFYIH